MKRLSWNEIEVRAASFSKEWAGAKYERGETHNFYVKFFEIFGITLRHVAAFEEPVKKLGNKQGFIDLFWKGTLLVEHKSAGRSLSSAKEQALDYFPGLKEYELPRFLLLCDFQNWELHDLDEGNSLSFTLPELPKYIQAFSFIRGQQERKFRQQDPVNIAASELMGRLHDALEDAGYVGHDLERLLVRLIFCLFADDTGIFEPRDIFATLIQERSAEDGSDVGQWITQLFEVLNEPEDKRQSTLDKDLAAFPYVNGELFKERLRVPGFTSKMRSLLLEACEFNWDAISPAIFGALFQSVMEPGERRSQGAHYTTEQNILKVIEPLFLDELRSEFRRIAARKDGGRRAALEQFHTKLSKLRFLDPACGCGNFLIITYRELRRLEVEILRELWGKQQVTNVENLARLNVDQFHGIEIAEFPSLIAEVALWMTDHIENNRLSLEFGQVFTRIPLRVSPHIHNADALDTDWSVIIAAEDCDYVFGNPPFVGSKYQSAYQRDQVRRIAALGGSGGSLDYVAAWLIRASEYSRAGKAKVGFVTTNSMTQGEQVAQLWPILFDRWKMEISFAHRTFPWGSDAGGKAQVHVIVLGLTRAEDVSPTKRLFSYPDNSGHPIESPHVRLSPYLFDASRLSNPHLVVREVGYPINGAPSIASGSQPIDGGAYLFTRDEKEQFLRIEPKAESLFRPYIGTQELIGGVERWILCTVGADPSAIHSMPEVKRRIEMVRDYRRKSARKSTLAIADYPTSWNVETIPDRPFLAIPEVSSEHREYVPIAYLRPPTVPSNKIRVLLGSDLWYFGILTSEMHMAWLRIVGGRLESRFQYSIGIVYNNFPLPQATDKARSRVVELAQSILDIRAQYLSSSLGHLYHRSTMPRDLRQAHRALDSAVDKLYTRQVLHDDIDRIEILFPLYEALTGPLAAEMQTKVRRKRV